MIRLLKLTPIVLLVFLLAQSCTALNAQDRLMVSVLRCEGTTIQETIENQPLKLAESTAQVELGNLLSFHSGQAASEIGLQTIEENLGLLGETVESKAEIAAAKLTDIGLSGMSLLLKGSDKSLFDNEQSEDALTLNQKAQGYRGVWYMNQPSNDEYVYKYSGGLGTYCAKHRPFAIYSREANKTFFCYGGAKSDNDRALLHMVSYFDHATKTVPRPTVLLDKKTGDAHDNPVISIDKDGHIWIFSTSHGRARPSFVHKSVRPYDIAEFELVNATRVNDAVGKEVPLDNFSYMQVWNEPAAGFAAFFTRYNYPAKRTICFMNSSDGKAWSQWQRIAAIDDGHYQISGTTRGDHRQSGDQPLQSGGQAQQSPSASQVKLGSMFNYHPDGKGLNWRTNLYYVETVDNGATWSTAGGERLHLPLVEAINPALIRNYENEGLNVYLKDIQFDENDRPILLYITSKGYQSGPQNNPRSWTIAKWTGTEWRFSVVTTSDNNYDFGELFLKSSDEWMILGPTETGPQPFNPGGEVAAWISTDQGVTWSKQKQLTAGSSFNHTYVRQVQNGHQDFVAIWADGHGRQPSKSSLYIADAEGNVFLLPRDMGTAETAKLEKVFR